MMLYLWMSQFKENTSVSMSSDILKLSDHNLTTIHHGMNRKWLTFGGIQNLGIFRNGDTRTGGMLFVGSKIISYLNTRYSSGIFLTMTLWYSGGIIQFFFTSSILFVFSTYSCSSSLTNSIKLKLFKKRKCMMWL